MKRSTHDQRPLFDAWFAWHELPDHIRQQTLDVLTTIFLETVDSQNLETQEDDASPR